MIRAVCARQWKGTTVKRIETGRATSAAALVTAMDRDSSNDNIADNDDLSDSLFEDPFGEDAFAPRPSPPASQHLRGVTGAFEPGESTPFHALGQSTQTAILHLGNSGSAGTSMTENRIFGQETTRGTDINVDRSSREAQQRTQHQAPKVAQQQQRHRQPEPANTPPYSPSDRRNRRSQNAQQASSQDQPLSDNSEGGDRKVTAFPWVLYGLLEDAETKGFDDVISWHADGERFRVHNRQKFESIIMPGYFKQSKYKSFQKQLNIYGFERTTKGPNKGDMRHHLFVRHQKDLCQKMTRRKSKPGQLSDGSAPGLANGSAPSPAVSSVAASDLTRREIWSTVPTESLSSLANDRLSGTLAPSFTSPIAPSSVVVPGEGAISTPAANPSPVPATTATSSYQAPRNSPRAAELPGRPTRSNVPQGQYLSSSITATVAASGDTDLPIFPRPLHPDSMLPGRGHSAGTNPWMQNRFELFQPTMQRASSLLDRHKLEQYEPEIADEIIRTFRSPGIHHVGTDQADTNSRPQRALSDGVLAVSLARSQSDQGLSNSFPSILQHNQPRMHGTQQQQQQQQQQPFEWVDSRSRDISEQHSTDDDVNMSSFFSDDM